MLPVVYVCHYAIRDLTYRETALEMHVPIGTVRSRLSKTRTTMWS